MYRAKKYGLIVLLLLSVYTANSQYANMQFTKLDSIARKKNAPSIDSLFTLLVKPCTTEIGKVRAIFIWISEHISYDVTAYHKSNKNYTLYYDNTPEDSTRVYAAYNSEVVEEVFKKRKAVCDGYSRLFKYMCDKANINCVVVEGYSRSIYDTIGLVQSESNHAWNAVHIDHKWYLLDVTWASGYTDEKVNHFYKAYNNFYFLTDPAKFINTHLPVYNKWQLLDTVLDIVEFYRQPLITEAYYEKGICSINPCKGIIELKKTDSIIVVQLCVNDTTAEGNIDIVAYKKRTRSSVSTDFNSDLNNVAESAIIDKKQFLKRAFVIDKNTYQLEVMYNYATIIIYAIVWKEE